MTAGCEQGERDSDDFSRLPTVGLGPSTCSKDEETGTQGQAKGRLFSRSAATCSLQAAMSRWHLPGGWWDQDWRQLETDAVETFGSGF